MSSNLEPGKRGWSSSLPHSIGTFARRLSRWFLVGLCPSEVRGAQRGHEPERAIAIKRATKLMQ
jgi:hypothetical protein